MRASRCWLAALLVAVAIPAVAAAQTAGSNLTGTTGVIAVDKVGNKIRFLDPATLAQVKVIDPPGKSVHELTVAFDHKTAYVPLYGEGIYGANPEPNNKVLVIDLGAQAISKVIDLGQYRAPHGMVPTRDGKLWVVCDQDNKLLLIDPVAGKIEATYDAPGVGAHFLAILPDESKLYVSNKAAPPAVFDLRQRKFVGVLALSGAKASGPGAGSEGLTPTPDGKHLLIIDNTEHAAIHVIDTATDRELSHTALIDTALTNPKRSRLMKLMLSPNAKTLTVSSFAGGQAWIVDMADMRKQTMIPVAKGPQGIAYPADGHSVIVSSHDSGLLTRIDLATRKPVAAIDGGAGIEVLAFY